MCYALLQVGYSNNTEQAGIIAIEKEEELRGKLEEVMNRPGVTRVTVFKRQATHKEVTTWETESYDL